MRNENPPILARCLPDPQKEIFFMRLPKWVLPFLTNQVAHFISCEDMGCFNSSGNILCLHFFIIKCPVFHFLDLDGRILNLVDSYLKIQSSKRR